MHTTVGLVAEGASSSCLIQIPFLHCGLLIHTSCKQLQSQETEGQPLPLSNTLDHLTLHSTRTAYDFLDYPGAGQTLPRFVPDSGYVNKFYTVCICDSATSMFLCSLGKI